MSASRLSLVRPRLIYSLLSQLRSSLITVLDNFVEHAAHLENFDDGWSTLMGKYLSSVQHIVGQQAVVRASKSADTASVPTSFLEELETLRDRVEELSDERVKLRSELSKQIAETNVLRALPGDRSPQSPSGVSALQNAGEPFLTSCCSSVSQSPLQIGQLGGQRLVCFSAERC